MLPTIASHNTLGQCGQGEGKLPHLGQERGNVDLDSKISHPGERPDWSEMEIIDREPTLIFKANILKKSSFLDPEKLTKNSMQLFNSPHPCCHDKIIKTFDNHSLPNIR